MALIISVFPKKEIMISEQIHSPHKASQCVRNLFSAGVSSKLTVFCFKACDSTKTSAERREKERERVCGSLVRRSFSTSASDLLDKKDQASISGVFIKIEQCNEMSELNKINEETKSFS